MILANQLDRVLDVYAPTKIKRLEIAGGAIAQANETGFGIRAENDRLDIKRSLITGNTGVMANASSGGVRRAAAGRLSKHDCRQRSDVQHRRPRHLRDARDGSSILVKLDGDREHGRKPDGRGLHVSFTRVVRSRRSGQRRGGVRRGSSLNGGTVLKDSLVADNDSVPSGMFTFGGGGVCMGSDSQDRRLDDHGQHRSRGRRRGRGLRRRRRSSTRRFTTTSPTTRAAA